jgi:dipeptide/tripeptide permease
VTFLGGYQNWRTAIVIALGHVALAGNKQLDDGGVTFLGGNVNWRSAIVIALGHVALGSGSFIGQGG